MNEELGDDLDLIDPGVLGEVIKSVTDSKNTTLQIKENTEDLSERITEVNNKIEKETNGYIKKKLEERLSMLTGKVGVVYVGADSAVELKEKKDRVEDAIHATKAALQEGIIPGGGVALLNASQIIKPINDGYNLLLKAIQSPYNTILENAGYSDYELPKTKSEAGSAKGAEEDWVGIGVDVTCGCYKRMVESGIIDLVLVTKAALKNAISVATTIMSADCIISNVRTNEGN